ncbi:MAG TPA: hypothetical protein VFE42_10430 [Chloroflexota bacterium]|nr:hypothetical protein [Chloroflexota bacterium]
MNGDDDRGDGARLEETKCIARLIKLAYLSLGILVECSARRSCRS